MKTRLILTAAGLALFATASMAAPSNITSSHRADYYASGKHRFYAWCANGQDRVVYQDGASAPEARARLAGAAGPCQLVWQGRIAG